MVCRSQNYDIKTETDPPAGTQDQQGPGPAGTSCLPGEGCSLPAATTGRATAPQMALVLGARDTNRPVGVTTPDTPVCTATAGSAALVTMPPAIAAITAGLLIMVMAIPASPSADFDVAGNAVATGGLRTKDMDTNGMQVGGRWLMPQGLAPGHNGGFLEREVPPSGGRKPHLVLILFDDYVRFPL